MSNERDGLRINEWNRMLVDLARSPALESGELQPMLEQITEVAARAMRVARASVWLYDEQRSAIRCLDLFEREKRAHSAGIVLGKKDFPGYFRALEEERNIPAHDAHTDPRTSE